MENNKLITLRSYSFAIDANIAKNVLENEEIECFLFDENINSINPLYAVATGGIKLKVYSEEAGFADKILKEWENKPTTNEVDEVVCCPKCGSQQIETGFLNVNGFRDVLSFLFAFFLSVFPLKVSRKKRCKDCGKIF